MNAKVFYLLLYSIAFPTVSLQPLETHNLTSRAKSWYLCSLSLEDMLLKTTHLHSDRDQNNNVSPVAYK